MQHRRDGLEGVRPPEVHTGEYAGGLRVVDEDGGCRYPPLEDSRGAGGEADNEEEGGESSELKIDRAEMIHLLQDFEIMGRAAPPEGMCGVFVGCGQSLNPTEFKRCIARAALALAPDAVGGAPLDSGDAKLRWLLRQMPLRIEYTKLPVLDVQRRVRVLAAAEHIAGLFEL